MPGNENIRKSGYDTTKSANGEGAGVRVERSKYEGPKTFYSHIRTIRHVDLIGGSLKERGSAIAAAVVPDLETASKHQWSVFVADFTGVGSLDELTAETKLAGHRVSHWEASTKPDGLLSHLTTEQLVDVLGASSSQEHDALSEDAESVLLSVAKALEVPDETGSVVAPSVTLIHRGIQYLLDRKGTGLEVDQCDVLDKIYTSEQEKAGHTGSLIALDTRINLLASNDSGEVDTYDDPYDDDESIRMVTCSVKDIGGTTKSLTRRRKLLAQTTLALLAERKAWDNPEGVMLHGAEWSKPEVIVIAGAEYVDPAILKRVANFCEEKSMKAIFSYGEVNAETAKTIGTRGVVGVMGIGNWNEADMASKILGEITIRKQIGDGESYNQGISVGGDDGTSITSNKFGVNERGGGESHSANGSDSLGFDQNRSYGIVEWRKLVTKLIARLPSGRIWVVDRLESESYGPLAFTQDQAEDAAREQVAPLVDRDEVGGRIFEEPFKSGRTALREVRHKRWLNLPRAKRSDPGSR